MNIIIKSYWKLASAFLETHVIYNGNVSVKHTCKDSNVDRQIPNFPNLLEETTRTYFGNIMFFLFNNE